MLLGVLHGVDPGGRVVGAFEVEAAGVYDLAERHVRLRGLDDLCVLLQAAYDGLELGNLLGRHLVALVEHERGTKLNLLDEQAFDVVLVDVVGQQVTSSMELVVHARAVHYGDDVVQGQRGMPAVAALVAEVRDGVGNRDRLADARRLDDDVVEVARVGNLAELAGEVVGERAAEAPVRHGDEVAVYLGEPALLDERGVHVDLADVVDDDGGTDALLILKDVVEKRGLAGPEVAGEQGDLRLLAGLGHGCVLPCAMRRVPARGFGIQTAHYIPQTCGGGVYEEREGADSSPQGLPREKKWRTFAF